MRRLIAWLYRACFGLSVRSNQQHICDLQHQLNLLVDARHALDDQIDSAVTQLLAAFQRRDELARQLAEPKTRRAGDIPRINLEQA